MSNRELTFPTITGQIVSPRAANTTKQEVIAAVKQSLKQRLRIIGKHGTQH